MEHKIQILSLTFSVIYTFYTFYDFILRRKKIRNGIEKICFAKNFSIGVKLGWPG